MSYSNSVYLLKPSRARIAIAIILFITLMVSYLDRTNVSVLIADPEFLKDMGIAGQPARMGLLMTTFLFAYGFSNLFAGFIGNLLGPRKAMTLAVAIWGVSVAIGGLAQSFSAMIAARILLGIGEGVHWPMQSSFVKNWFPIQERARANSAWLLGLMVGPMISMPLLSAVVAGHGWRASFAVLLACSFVPLFLISLFTRDDPAQSKWVNKAELQHIVSGRESQESGAEGGAGWGFLKLSSYWLIVVGFLCSACMFWGTMAWLPSYLKVARGFSWAQMGALATAPYLLGSITVVIAGLLEDKFARKSVLPALSLFGAACSILAGAKVTDNFTSAVCMASAIGFIGLGAASYWTMMQDIVNRRAVGNAAGVMNGVASLGSAMVPTVVGLLIAGTGSYFSGLMFLVTTGAIGGFCMIALLFRQT